MIKFLRKSILFLAITLFIGFFLQLIIDASIKHSEMGCFQLWNQIIESKINSGLIIQGSSRAKEHFNKDYIDSSLKISTCNLGMEGTGFDLQFARFLCYLSNNKKPKYIIQNIDCSGTLENSAFDVDQYLPYLNNKIIRNATLENKIFNTKDFYIPLYKYTHNTETKVIILDGINNMIKNKFGIGAFEKYEPVFKAWDTTFFSFKKKNISGIYAKVDTSSLNKFNCFLKICKEENIKVIFVYTPEFIELQKLTLNRDSIIKIYENFSTKYKVPIFDYSKDSICLDTINFYNSRHMNNIGVNKFNLKLINDLKNIIK